MLVRVLSHRGEQGEAHDAAEADQCLRLVGGVGRCGEMWGGVGRCGEVWGGMEQCIRLVGFIDE